MIRQTFEGWELLVVDDASEEDIREVVARASRPARSLHPTTGQRRRCGRPEHGHRRRGRRIVAFLHSDDEFFPTKLERQVKLFARSPDTIGAVESAVEVVWPDSTECWPPGFEGADASDVLACTERRVHVSGLLLRRLLAVQLRFDEQLRGAEDRDFCIRLLQNTHLAFSPEPLSRVSKAETGSRLTHQNHGPIYAYLLKKYLDDIAADPRVHADWQYRIARAYAGAGQMPEARRALRRSVRLDPARPRRWLLWLASFGGDTVYGAASEPRFGWHRQPDHRAVYSSAHD